MQMKSIATVRAMYPSKGTMENGKEYDNTKVHIDTPLTGNKEGFGVPSPQMNWGTSQNYKDFTEKYPNIKQAFEAEITWENQTSGKTAVLVVVDIVPVQAQPQPQPKTAPAVQKV